MTIREVLLNFLQQHYKENPFRKQTTNERDVDDFLAEQNLQQCTVIRSLPHDEEKHDCEKEGHYEDCNSGYCLFCGVKFIERNFDNDD